MTPAQLLQRIPAPTPPPSVVLEGEVVESGFVPLACVGGTHYTSEAMEEDFSISVELLMNTPKLLRFLQDADKHFDILGEKARQELNEHIETVEDFIGQWLND